MGSGHPYLSTPGTELSEGVIGLVTTRTLFQVGVWRFQGTIDAERRGEHRVEAHEGWGCRGTMANSVTRDGKQLQPDKWGPLGDRRGAGRGRGAEKGLHLRRAEQVFLQSGLPA